MDRFKRAQFSQGISERSLGRLAVWIATHRRAARYATSPARFDLPYEEVRFPSSDGVSLAGWLIPCEGARTLVVLCHGIGSTRMRMLSKARRLYRMGHASLILDFRARGDSGGTHCTLGLREADDILGAVKYLRSRSDTAKLRLAGLGESLGAASLVLAMAREPRIEAAVLEACFTSMREAVERRLRYLFRARAPRVTEWFAGQLRLRIGLEIDEISPGQAIADLAPRPLLLIHDSWDHGVPLAASRALLERAGASASLWVVPRCPHVCAELTAPEEFERRVREFLKL